LRNREQQQADTEQQQHQHSGPSECHNATKCSITCPTVLTAAAAYAACMCCGRTPQLAFNCIHTCLLSYSSHISLAAKAASTQCTYLHRHLHSTQVRARLTLLNDNWLCSAGLHSP
jgi:hypothetical protein